MLKELLKEQTAKTVKSYLVNPEKHDNDMGAPIEAERPSIYFDSKTIPELKDWEVDQEYCVMLKIKQVSKSMHTKGKKEIYDGRFVVHEVAVIEKQEKKQKPKSSIEEAYGV